MNTHSTRTAPRTTTRRRGLAALATLAVGTGLAVTGTAVTSAAQAADGQVGQRETVCAQSLDVREKPVGAWQGTLTTGETFDVQKVDGDWVYGFAYGHVNRNGWVQQGWFC